MFATQQEPNQCLHIEVSEGILSSLLVILSLTLLRTDYICSELHHTKPYAAQPQGNECSSCPGVSTDLRLTIAK